MSSKRSVLSEVSSGSGPPQSLTASSRERFFPSGKIDPNCVSNEVLDALRGGSSNPRGGPLWLRQCQDCKDVAMECRLGMKCPAILNKIDAYLMKNHTKEAPDGSDIVRVIRELADKGDLRAKQVYGPAGSLKPNSERTLQFVRQWTAVLTIQEYLEGKADFPLQTAEERAKFDEGTLEVIKGLHMDMNQRYVQTRTRQQQRFMCAFKKWLEDMDPDEKKKLKQAGGMNVASHFLDKFFTDGAGSLDDAGPKKITAQDRKAHTRTLTLYVERQGVGC
eukprot:TRINITY_DN62851_c0_g1_i1.p1 TRINITY_DN62851_c0_g1~~TRINITY_DN62851_c0_g1_i1.p1  ORF type:complete len:277 (-),score=63.63 TRINITY_DN62851_c0_g1_i1:91-921(-)